MKQIVLNQRFQFFTISAYKDYSLLAHKEENEIRNNLELNLENVDFINIFVDDNVGLRKIDKAFGLYLQNRKNLKKKNTKFFYTDKDSEIISLAPWLKKTESFSTTSEKHLRKHYGRPFSSVSISTYERKIIVDDDTISVRFYQHTKHRAVNNRFFKKNKSATGFKINFKTGNVVTYDGSNGMRIRQNDFNHLYSTLINLFKLSNSHVVFSDKKEKHPINVEFSKIFNDEEFMNNLSHVFLSKLPYDMLMLSKNGDNHLDRLYSMVTNTFVTINKIKVPNNYDVLLRTAYPTKVFLKKNDNKLIASVLDRLGLKSKSLIKLLHVYPNMDIRSLVLLAKYFGYRDVHKFIHNINSNYFHIAERSNKKYEDRYYMGSIYQMVNNKYEYDILEDEKTCLLRLINEFMNEISSTLDTMSDSRLSDVLRNQFNQINDHLDLLCKIRNYIPETRMRAQTMIDFHNEHIEFSKIDRAIKKGYSIKYIFEDALINHIEEPIYVFDDKRENIINTFYPVILKIDAEYSEEGSHMHHCVASYADRERSLIVSIREGNPQGYERVTCEFNTGDKSCVQAKYFCNAAPPEKFEFALGKVKHRVKIFRGSIKSTSKEKVPLIINGVQIGAKEESNDDFFFQVFGENDLPL